MADKRGKNTIKTYQSYIYSWSPDAFEKKGGHSGGVKYFCSATPNSNGEDWITSYCYNLLVVNSNQEKLAYVACDYVS